jgi:hypothetical protein
MKLNTVALGAIFALTVVSASAADPVYSVNVVGYHKASIPPGFSMIANQVESTNNVVGVLFPSPPNGTVIYKFNGTGFDANNYFFGWGNPNMPLAVGDGFFIYNPLPTAITNIFAGEVQTGLLTNQLPAGFSIQSSQVPQSGALDSVLGYPVQNGDVVYFYNNQTGQYQAFNYFFGWGGGNAPVPAVGQSFFVFKGSTTDWVRNFNPNAP